MGTKNEGLLEDDLDIEKGFNDAIDDLRKSLTPSSTLRKAKDEDDDFEDTSEDSEVEDSEVEDEDEDEGDEAPPKDKGKNFGPPKKMNKSVEDMLREDPEAAAAMDVEPFLLQFAKAMDESLSKIVNRVVRVEKLTKSIGAATVASSDLQKSTRDMVKTIGGIPVASGSIRRLEKARFAGETTEVDTRFVLEKSRDWVKTGKVDLMEAGNIEGRINKGLLGKVNDRLDQKVVALLREEK